MTCFADLHVHSVCSDGLLRPAELVAMARAKGLAVIALADHDSVDGVDEAVSAGLTAGVQVIPAVELSVEFRSYEDVHLLGYYIDHHDGDFRARLEEFRRIRDSRGKAILERINQKLKTENRSLLSEDEVLSRAEGALGRPHLARALIARGYAATMEDAFVRYLEPCNVPKQYFPAADAIAEIRRIGGVSVLAHPVSISPDWGKLERVIRELSGIGLQGIEVYSNMCSPDDVTFLLGCAARFGLAVTGGSDFHGPGEYADMGCIRKEIPIGPDVVKSLERAAKTR